MRRDLLIITLIVVIIAAGAVIAYTYFLGPGSATITSVTTDKDLYHSKEVMNITVSASARGDMSNTTLKLVGIKSRHGDYQLDKEIPVTLTPGQNSLRYNHTLPTCSSCSGLSAGMYDIDVELVRNGTVVSNMTYSFDLEQ
ncbi:MAG: hypothetical protein KA094_01145 [Methanoregulaceae archaeon]|jgi:hypothetical protein|nr:hypothetical protein [Methanoregulaceae archaeon]NLH24854.1 hypothetical protein [Methanomicrobiales archaeon]